MNHDMMCAEVIRREPVKSQSFARYIRRRSWQVHRASSQCCPVDDNLDCDPDWNVSPGRAYISKSELGNNHASRRKNAVIVDVVRHVLLLRNKDCIYFDRLSLNRSVNLDTTCIKVRKSKTRFKVEIRTPLVKCGYGCTANTISIRFERRSRSTHDLILPNPPNGSAREPQRYDCQYESQSLSLSARRAGWAAIFVPAV